MQEVKRGETKEINLTTSAVATDVTVTLTHEFGDSIRPATAASGSGTSFSFELTEDDTNACGTLKIVWNYTMGTAKSKTEYIKVVQPYVLVDDFIIEFPELEDQATENFDAVEKQVRMVVDTYCGQTFEAYPNLTLKIDGNGGNSLRVWYRIEHLESVLINGDEASDLIDYVEIAPDSEYYIRKKSRYYGDGKSETFSKFWSDSTGKFFNARNIYHVKGDFGWGYVPTNVEEASKLLISDWYNQDSTHRRHGVVFAGIGPVQTNYKTDLVGTTGNIDADVLLMDYTKFLMDHI